MTVAAPRKQRWDTGAYLTIRSARYRDGNLVIRFADGEDVVVPVDWFAARRLVEPDWTAVDVGPLWITVPTADGDVEISWLAIRLLTDAGFRAHWERHAGRGA
jgi:hypothetical protein